MFVNTVDSEIRKEYKDIIIEGEDKSLSIKLNTDLSVVFSGTGNFVRNEDNNKELRFDITSDLTVYPYFKELYSDIVSGRAYAFDGTGTVNPELREYYEYLNTTDDVKEIKDRIVKNGKVSWISDDLGDNGVELEHAPIMTLEMKDEVIICKIINKSLFNDFDVIVSRSMSSKSPFNYCFTRFFESMNLNDGLKMKGLN